MIKIIRFIFKIPLIINYKLCNIYYKFLKIIDFRNYELFWEDFLQNMINLKTGKKIYIDKKKYIIFYTPTTISSYRSFTFFSKEPETIDWINKKGGKDKIFFDVGGNMGLYSIYFSKKFKSISYIFEPSFVNLNLIQRNINLNLLNDRLILIPNPLYKRIKISKLYQLKNDVAGLASTTFDSIFFKNKILLNSKKNKLFKTNILSCTLDYLVKNKIIKKPNLIKIDVDGNEFEVILGAKNLLEKNNNISLLVEIQSYNKKRTFRLLKSFGYNLVSSRKSNFIWEKK